MDSLILQLEKWFLARKDADFSKTEVSKLTFMSEDNTIYAPETITRKCRDLESQKVIAGWPDEQGHTRYRFCPEPHRINYITWSEREELDLPLTCKWKAEALKIKETPSLLKVPVAPEIAPKKPYWGAVKWAGTAYRFDAPEKKLAFMESHEGAFDLDK